MATLYWADKWEARLKEKPELLSAERAEMKAAFDSMQMEEMEADRERQLPKAHFSAVMFMMGQSGRMQIGKASSHPKGGDASGNRSRRKIPIPVLQDWASKWEEYLKSHPELVGQDRETMKAGFDDLQKIYARVCGKAHFSAVMNFLRISGRHDIGAWKGYAAPVAGGLAQAVCKEVEVEVVISLVGGLISSMGDQMASDFTGDIRHLSDKSGTSSIEVQWEEDRLVLSGPASAVSRARAELLEILHFYFPNETIALPDDEHAGALDSGKSAPQAEPRHWTQSIRCTLSDQQRQKTLSKTQQMREKQRGAVKHWADRWEEWVKLRPEWIGAERNVMKAGFDEMQTAEAGTAVKVHFSLVMNFLRQSGRRTIGAWKDYTPKSWNG